MNLERVQRFQNEIEQFLVSFDSGDNEQVLVLLFYHSCIRGYSPNVQKLFTVEQKKIEDLISSLFPERIKESAETFDFNVYVDSFLNLYENWRNHGVENSRMIDAAVNLLVMLHGYCSAITHPACSGSFEDEYEKKYNLLKHPAWSLMHDEFAFRYAEE